VNTKLFGQFLLEKGYIDRHQLLRALKEQRACNLKLGELAVATGLLTVGEVDTIAFRQLCNDEPFGESAVALGLLSRGHLVELLHRQSADRKLLGQILLAFGDLDEATLQAALDAYVGQKAGEEAALRRIFDETECAAVAPTCVSVMGRVFQRTVGSALSFHSVPARRAMVAGDKVWSQVITRGSERWVLAVQIADAHARSVAEAVLDMPVEELDALALDAVAEFMNIVSGHVCGNLDGSRARVIASAPRVQTPPEFLASALPLVALRCDTGSLSFTYLIGRAHGTVRQGTQEARRGMLAS
jgi:CheY-specific phosphatase CheX